MSQSLTKHLTPEAEELEVKKKEFLQLQSELSERELELSTAKAELAALERRYLDVVGRRYAELDRIEAEVAQETARRNSSDKAAQAAAAAAIERAAASADPESSSPSGTDQAGEKPPEAEFEASGELKALFRQAARLMHPDLALDPAEKERRHRFMSAVNRAYADGDVSRIRQLLDEWSASPEQVHGEDIGAELVRVIRQIAQVRRRLAAIRDELEQIQQSDLARLKCQFDEAAAENRDLFQEIAERIDLEIEKARRQWDGLWQGSSP